MASSTIADTAMRASQLLLCCQKNFVDELNRVATTQTDRFNLWAANIGVFSSRQASLDYRLRTASTAKAAVDGNLEILCVYLLSALAGVEEPPDDDLDAFAEVPITEIDSFGLKLMNRSSSGDSDVRIQALISVESVIDTLHQLSLAIRKASNRNNLTKLPNLYSIDPPFKLIGQLNKSGTIFGEIEVPSAHFDATLAFEDFVRRVLRLRWLTPDIGKDLQPDQEMYRQTMLERRVKSISARRRQLAYFQDHQTRLANRAATNSIHTMSQYIRTAVDSPAALLSLSPSHLQDTQTQQPASQRRSHEVPSETIGSESLSNTFRLTPSTSAPSSATSSAGRRLATKTPFEIPPAPELKPQEKEKMCPYCCLVYPANIFSTNKRSSAWKKHLLDDLQPYVCLFRNCSQPGKTVRRSGDQYNI
ncbi:hypothetical protein GGR51DRAFT_540685 [Nemania sp. FL0031]|nr:hypothetical protein GGR51DRAFT_540685 [Nemania sp. FL0031]